MANTTNFNFELIDFDTIPWHTKEHDNWRLADATLAQYISISGIKGVWTNAITIAVNDKYVDKELGTIWTANTAHTTASTGTFASDRTTNSTYWTSFSIDQAFRGTWATGTNYAVNDFVVDGYKYAVAETAHTSGATFAGDSANWIILIDATNVITYATEWANKAADSLVSTDAGGDGVDDYSAKHFSVQAASSATSAASSATSAAAAVGGVKVSSNDTTSEPLDGKLVAGTGISLTEVSDGSDETLTVANTSPMDVGLVVALG